MRMTAVSAMVIGALTFAPGSSAAVELRVLEWEGYISIVETHFEDYAKARGMDVDLVFLKTPDGSNYYISTADDIFETLRRNSADITTPTHNYYQQERGKLLSILHPIDASRLSNFADISPALQPSYYMRDRNGALYGVPLLGGSYALAYNAAKTAMPESWTVLLDPAAKGTFAVTGDQVEANVYQMAILAGVDPADVYDFDTFTPEQRQRTRDNLNALVANAATFWGGMPTPDMMGDLTYVTDYWFGVAAANQSGQNWQIAQPEEGVTVWLDTIAIARQVGADEEKLEAAYMLLDYMIGVEAQTAIAATFGSVIVNEVAKAALPDHLRDAQPKGYFFVDDRFWRPLTPRTRNAFLNMWDDAMAAAGR